jgi:DNA-directed RNA polymerase specialized sigma24 family protein
LRNPPLVFAGRGRRCGSGNQGDCWGAGEAGRGAIAALPAELREVIVLFEYEEMSQAEIAVAVGATVKAVEARIARAREKLRGALRRWV